MDTKPKSFSWLSDNTRPMLVMRSMKQTTHTFWDVVPLTMYLGGRGTYLWTSLGGHICGHHWGDIFVDITEGAYGIFVKEASHWVEWIGVIKLIGEERRSRLTMLLYPQNARLTVWCTKQEVLWIDCAKLTAAHGALFAQHPCQLIITAREMIEELPALVTKIGDMYKMEWKQQRELECKLASAYWYYDLLWPPTVWGLCDFSGPKEVKRDLHPCHLNT